MSISEQISTNLQIIAENEQKVYGAGHQKGYFDGYEQGLSDGTKEEQEKSIIITENGTFPVSPDENKVLSKVTVEVDVADSYYDSFWDTYQQSGERTNYHDAFAVGWTEDIFYPKYDLIATHSLNMFADSKIECDLGQRLKECGVVLDTSRSVNVMAAFYDSQFTAIPHISCASSDNLTNIFMSAKKLITVEKITVHKNIKTYSSAFRNCLALKNITFEGEIAASISFNSSAYLTNETLQSIIDSLADMTGADTSPVLTLNPTPKGKLTQEQIATITNKNWTLA